MSWYSIIKSRDRSKRAEEAKPTFIYHRDLALETEGRKQKKEAGEKQLVGPKYKEMPLTDENYNAADRRMQSSYHSQMKHYYLIIRDWARAHKHRNASQKIKADEGKFNMEGDAI